MKILDDWRRVNAAIARAHGRSGEGAAVGQTAMSGSAAIVGEPERAAPSPLRPDGKATGRPDDLSADRERSSQ